LPPAAPQPLLETLSASELRVLRYLPTNLSAPEAHHTTPQSAAPDQPGDLMPADVIGPGLRQRPGDPQTRELAHPPLLHRTPYRR
jgi:hypothetical protein